MQHPPTTSPQPPSQPYGKRKKHPVSKVKTILTLTLAITVLTVIATRLHNSRTPRHAWCVIYDKPPRTASTTAGLSLRKCWQSINLHHPPVERPPTTTKPTTPQPLPPVNILSMIALPHSHVAVGSQHFRIGEDELDAVRRECRRVLYITSTRGMMERLWSAAKYYGGGVESTRMNASMGVEGIHRSLQVFHRRWRGWEARYEEYPFNLTTTKPRQAPPPPSSASAKGTPRAAAASRSTGEQASGRYVMRPDYVIRYDNVHEDLGSLLTAFGCSGAFRTLNVHAERGEGEGEEEGETKRGRMVVEMHRGLPANLSGVRLRFGDGRHVRLVRRAPLVNEEGLRMARKVAHDIRSAERGWGGFF